MQNIDIIVNIEICAQYKFGKKYAMQDAKNAPAARFKKNKLGMANSRNNNINPLIAQIKYICILSPF